MPLRLLCIAGARPNFMKLAPLIRALANDNCFHPVLVHTGQHYDDRMSGQFFRDLEIPAPDHSLEVGSGSHAQQTAEIMKRFEPIVLEEKPDGVLVVGDVNSTIACALVAVKLGVPVIHVEAGLRSFDRSMPEEINRIVTDAISTLLLVTEETGHRNLLAEGIDESRIRIVGNLMIDTLRTNTARAEASSILEDLGIHDRYGVVTLHRPSNVDDAGQLQEILSALEVIGRELQLYFPVHPRTRSIIEQAGIRPSERIHFLEPLGYLEFLRLMSKSSIVLTDSGGIQEETTALGIPCLTLRQNTERPVTIELGTNRLAGTSRERILAAWKETKEQPKSGRIPPLWDGRAAGRCVQALQGFYQRA